MEGAARLVHADLGRERFPCFLHSFLAVFDNGALLRCAPVLGSSWNGVSAFGLVADQPVKARDESIAAPRAMGASIFVAGVDETQRCDS